MVDSLWLSVKVVSRPQCAVWVKNRELLSQEETFRNLILRLKDEQYFSERRVDKVNIEDNKHRSEEQLEFLPATQVYFALS